MADAWLGISSAHIDSLCGEQAAPNALANGLDGIDRWIHYANEAHWFILDLTQTYTIKKVRGRSIQTDDPIDVDVFVSDDKENWGDAVASGISTWQDIATWEGDQEIDSTDKDGRYIKVVINDTEDAARNLRFGDHLVPFAIFDVYGDVVAGTTVTPGTLSLTLTEFVPILKEVTTPTTLSLTLTEYAPILKEVLTPTTLSLTTTTYVPVLKEVTTPSTLSLTTTGYAPVLKEVTTPTTLSLTLTSYTPILKEVVTPTTLPLTLTNYIPVLKEVLTPTTLSLSTTGYVPVLAEIVTPTTLSLSLTGYAPVLNTSIVIGLLGLVLTGYAPTLGEEAPFRHAWGIIFG